MDDAALAGLVAAERIRRLLSLYGDAVSRGDATLIAELFAPDARVVIAGGAERIGRDQIVSGLERTLSGYAYLHQKYDAGLIDVDGTTARGRIGIMELNQPRGTQAVHAIFGVYEDQYRREGERWFFAQRVFTFQYRLILPASEVGKFANFSPSVSFAP